MAPKKKPLRGPVLKGGAFECKECIKTFDTKAELRQHEKVVHNEKLFKCNDCKFSTDTELGLRRHRTVAHTQKTHTCSHCDRSYPDAVSRRIHEKEHETKILCQICRLTLVATDDALKAHHKADHPNGKFIPQLYHDDGPDPAAPDPKRPYPCNLCQKYYPSRVRQIAHIRGVHIPSDKHICPTCNGKYSSDSNLKKHQTERHGEMQFACTHCGRKFADNIGRRRHETTCPIGKAATRNQDDSTSQRPPDGHEDANEEEIEAEQDASEIPPEVSTYLDPLLELYSSKAIDKMRKHTEIIRQGLSQGRLIDVACPVNPCQQLTTANNLRRFERAMITEDLEISTNFFDLPQKTVMSLLQLERKRELFSKVTLHRIKQSPAVITIKTFDGDTKTNKKDEALQIDIIDFEFSLPAATKVANTVRRILEVLPFRLSDLSVTYQLWAIRAATRIVLSEDPTLQLRMSRPILGIAKHNGQDDQLYYLVRVDGFDASKCIFWHESFKVTVGAFDVKKDIEIDHENRYSWIGEDPKMPTGYEWKFKKIDFDQTFRVAMLLTVKLFGFIGNVEKCTQQVHELLRTFWPRGKIQTRFKPLTLPIAKQAWNGQAFYQISCYAGKMRITPTTWMLRRMGTAHHTIFVDADEPERIVPILSMMLRLLHEGRTELVVWGLGSKLADACQMQEGYFPSPLAVCTDARHTNEPHVCPGCYTLHPHDDLSESSIHYYYICSKCKSIEKPGDIFTLTGGRVGYALLDHLKHENEITKTRKSAQQLKKDSNMIMDQLYPLRIDGNTYHDGYINQTLDIKGQKMLSWDGTRLNSQFPSVDAIDPAVNVSGTSAYHTLGNITITADSINRAVKHYPKIMLVAIAQFIESRKTGQATYENGIAIARTCLTNHYEYGPFGHAQQRDRIGVSVPANINDIVRSFRTFDRLTRTKPSSQVWRTYSHTPAGTAEQRLIWRPEHYDWLLQQLEYIAQEVFGAQRQQYQKFWMRKDSAGVEVFFPFSQYSIVVDFTWFDLFEVLEIKAVRNVTECQRPHSRDSPIALYSAEELFLVVANIWLRQVKADVDKGLPLFDLGRDELGCVPQPNLNSLLCASLGHKIHGQEMFLGLGLVDFKSEQPVTFDVNKVNMLWETQACNFAKFKYHDAQVPSILAQFGKIHRGELAPDQIRLLPEKVPRLKLTSAQEELDQPVDSSLHGGNDSALLSERSKQREDVLETQRANRQWTSKTTKSTTIDAYFDKLAPKLLRQDDSEVHDQEQQSEIDYYDESYDGVCLSTIPFPRPGDMDVTGSDVDDTDTTLVDDLFEDELYDLTRNMSNLSAACYAVVSFQVLANTSTIRNAINSGSSFMPFTGRDPELLHRLDDPTGEKHVELQLEVVNICAAITEGGEQLEPCHTDIMMLVSEGIHPKWTSDVRNDATEYYTWLIGHLEIATDTSQHITGPNQFITRGGTRLRLAAKRPEQLLNERYEDEVKADQVTKSLQYHLEEHNNAHLASGHDSPLTRLLEVQYVDLFGCTNEECDIEYRRIQYSFQIMLEFPPESITKSEVTLHEMMMHTLVTDKSETLPCPRDCQSSEGGSLPCNMKRKYRCISQLGETFAVEIRRHRMSMSAGESQTPTDESLQLIETRIAQYATFEVDFLKDVVKKYNPEHDQLPDHASLKEEYKIHAIAAFSSHLKHYVVFIKIKGYWAYFDSLQPLPVLRHPMMDWPQGYIETMLWYQRVDPSDTDVVPAQKQPTQRLTDTRDITETETTASHRAKTTQENEKQLILIKEVSDLRKLIETNRERSDSVAYKLDSRVIQALTLSQKTLDDCQRQIRDLKAVDEQRERDVTRLNDQVKRLEEQNGKLHDKLQTMDGELQGLLLWAASYNSAFRRSNPVAQSSDLSRRRVPVSADHFHAPTAPARSTDLPPNISGTIPPQVGAPLDGRMAGTPSAQRSVNFSFPRSSSLRTPTVARGPNLHTSQRMRGQGTASSSSLYHQFNSRAAERNEDEDIQGD